MIPRKPLSRCAGNGSQSAESQRKGQALKIYHSVSISTFALFEVSHIFVFGGKTIISEIPSAFADLKAVLAPTLPKFSYYEPHVLLTQNVFIWTHGVLNTHDEKGLENENRDL